MLHSLTASATTMFDPDSESGTDPDHAAEIGNVDAVNQKTSQQRIDFVVEALCQRGCRRVNQLLAVFDSGKEVPEFRSLASRERSAVVEELRQVMSVYDKPCDI